MSWPASDAMQLRPDLAAKVQAITAKAAERLPGRLEVLLSTRVAQLRDLPLPDGGAEVTADVGSWPSAGAITPAERSAIDFLERFMLDVRSIDDAVITGLKAHFDDDEVAAILFRLALLDGFAKFDRIFPPAIVSPGGT